MSGFRLQDHLNMTHSALTESPNDLDLLAAAEIPLATPAWFAQALAQPRLQGQTQVDGVEINFLRWGDPQLPGVVLTHGFMAHARCWAFVAPLLAHKYCLVAFDLSGMGDSGWRESYDVASRAEECQAVAKAAGLREKPALVCHSYGGSVGLTAAMTEPAAWRSLIVCDMAMLTPGETSRFAEHRERRAQRSPTPHRLHADFTSIRKRFRLAPEQPCENEYLVDYMAYFSSRKTDAGYCWKFDPRILSMADMRDDDWFHQVAPNFLNLPIPKALIYGEHSEMLSAVGLAYLAEQSTGQVPLVQIPSAYHHVMLDQPLALASSLDALLSTL